MTEAEIVARARACLGTRFRVQGRAIGQGLDCVGVVAHAFALAAVPAGYPLRGGASEAIVAAIARAGFVADAAGAGRLLLLAAGPFQHHLAIGTDRGFVHADAGLRRVVEVPGAPRWPLIAAWRKGD